MRNLITGAAGFIGSSLFESIEDSLGIDNFSHSCRKHGLREKISNFDVKDYRLLEEFIRINKNVNTIYHLAAQINVDDSIYTPGKYIRDNVIGTANILELARRNKINKVIVASTSEVYGTSQTSLMSETHYLDAQSPYGASKIAADRLAKSYIDCYGMDICILRNFNTFGPWQNDDSYGGVIAKFTKAAFYNEKIYIFGSGKQERDYMYIDDAIEAYKLSNWLKGVYNVGTGNTISIKEIAVFIKDITKSKSEIVHLKERPAEVQRLCCDNAKFFRDTGWLPKINFKEGIENYVKWYQDTLL